MGPSLQFAEINFEILRVQVRTLRARQIGTCQNFGKLKLFVLLSVARGHFVGAHMAMCKSHAIDYGIDI